MKLLLLIPLLSITGCCATSFEVTQKDGTKVKWTNYRAVWATDAYTATLTTNGASLTVSKSSVDSAAIQAAANGAAQGVAASILK